MGDETVTALTFVTGTALFLVGLGLAGIAALEWMSGNLSILESAAVFVVSGLGVASMSLLVGWFEEGRHA